MISFSFSCMISLVIIDIIDVFKSNRRRNFFCFWGDSFFVNSSAKILDVLTHSMSILLHAISWRSQCLWISMWRSLIISLLLTSVLIVCWLSHWMIALWLIRKCIALNSRSYQISFFSTIEMTSNSVLVKLVMTVRCLNVFQSIRSLNSLNA
jgi:hypothetical protein